uniref:hypothetical protein n=1 Tax=Streptomyces reticuliscabiei TaxID=146821 RepID=UPI001C4E7220
MDSNSGAESRAARIMTGTRRIAQADAHPEHQAGPHEGTGHPNPHNEPRPERSRPPCIPPAAGGMQGG